MRGRLAVVAGVVAVAMFARPGAAYDEEHQVTRGECALSSGKAKLRTVTDQSCDKHGACEGSTVITLTSARKKRLLRLDGGASDPTVSCADTAVTVSLPGGKKPVSVSLVYSPSDDRLALDAAVMRDLEQRWARPPASVDPDRDRWIELYGLIDSFDKRPEVSATLLGAREALAAGDWSATDKYLAAAAEHGAARDATMAGRRRDIAAQLAAARKRTPGPVVDNWRRIGRVLSEPVSPPNSEASWFWSGGKLCVQQDGATPGAREPFMRCYDPQARRWGERAPLARGPLDDAPKVTWHEGANVCDFENGWTIDGLNFGGAGICGYDFFADSLLLAAKGPVALATGGPRFFQLTRPGPAPGKVEQTPADHATVKRMVAASAGTRLAGGGDFLFDDESCTVFWTADSRKTWVPLERNGKGQPWRPICPPLVAPDQHTMAVAARRGAAVGTDGDVIDLWLITLTSATKGHD
jgi:hypothetical protein